MTTATEFDIVSAWGTWCDAFLKAKTVPMTTDQSKIFLSLILMERSGDPIPEEATKSFEYQVASKRKEFMGLDINPYAILMLCVLAESVGTVVMYITALTRHYQRTGKAIDIAELANVFPMGFLSPKELDRLWDEQKGAKLGQDFGNLVDTVSKESF